jgi:toxin ParE1/3/4
MSQPSSSKCASVMSSAEHKRVLLSPKALTDLEEIWRYTAETWSIDQADRYVDALTHMFDVIAAMPTIARERAEFDPPVRIHAHQSHLIIYTIGDDHIVVLRLLGARQDWSAILHAMEAP